MSNQGYTVRTNDRTEESDFNTAEIVIPDQIPAIAHQIICRLTCSSWCFKKIIFIPVVTRTTPPPFQALGRLSVHGYGWPAYDRV